MSDAHQVSLQDLAFRPNECIQYQYNMYIPWRVQVRYEKTVPYQPKRVYPYRAFACRYFPSEVPLLQLAPLILVLAGLLRV